MTNYNLLKSELRNFTGTEHYYRNPLFAKFIYTDGIKFLAEQINCYWLIDYVFSNQLDEKIKFEPFQSWNIMVNEDNNAVITVTDGAKKFIKSFKLEFTDFPIEICGENGFTIWFIDKNLLLPSEY